MPITTSTRPVLRYPGGKWILAPWIIAHFPPHQCYVEPFMGAASVFFRKPRAYAEVLNDLNNDIVNLFGLLRDPGRARILERLLRLTPFAAVEYEAAYTPTDDRMEQARRFLVRSWQGFNSEGALGYTTGWRRNRDRRGTLPAHDWGRFPDHITSFTQRLQGVIIESRDALALLPVYDRADTLWYIDPPYDETACPNFNGYGESVDHAALSVALHQLTGMIVLSGYRSPTYDRLYADWCRVDHRAYTGTGKAGARTRLECLWLNPTCQTALTQLPLFGETP
jgi:DNA adenine methylase